MDVEKLKVPVEKLRKVCNCEEELAFCKSSEEIDPFDGVIGQERAVNSIEFGLSMKAPGYNIFVVGPQGTGKSTYVDAVVSKVATKRPQASDWCYINNFSDKNLPLAVSLPAGQGMVFQKDMDDLISFFKTAVPAAFEDNFFQQKRDAVTQNAQERIRTLFFEIEQEAAQKGFRMQQNPPGFIFVPLMPNGEVMPQEEYRKLSEQKRKEIDEIVRALLKKLDLISHEVQNIARQEHDDILILEKQAAVSVAEPEIAKLREKYSQFQKILAYLDDVLKDIENNYNIFRSDPQNQNQMLLMMAPDEGDPFVRYKVNLFVNNEKTEGAPVIFEPNPNYYNLLGEIEYKSQIMSINTDFTRIKSGALQKANGGYLVLQAKDVLMEPLCWDKLKKALKYKQTGVENIAEQYRLVPTMSLKAESIELDVKVILIGTPQIYDILYFADEDFRKLFKVKVDFDVEMPRTRENVCRYVSFIGSVCRKYDQKHFDQSGMARVIEYGSALANNQNKLSTRFNELTGIIYESLQLALLENAQFVEGRHVDMAIDQRKKRANQLQEKMIEQILTGNILINTKGNAVGQINGLSVIDSGGYYFGLPSRITARTYIGNGGVINIERETKMSGNIHSKGVLILSGYLGGKFAQDKPLGVTAQITFEQNYGGVDGDSASSTELYAILSSLSGMPIKQNLAVTGSVDQFGDIQPIGGVNEKIEGFFEVCKGKGLTGEHGVIIPIQNVENLMLNQEIIDAVKENKFSIYAVKCIEEGIELLFGTPAGKPDENGKYPPDSVFYHVEQKLQEYNNRIKEFKKDNK